MEHTATVSYQSIACIRSPTEYKYCSISLLPVRAKKNDSFKAEPRSALMSVSLEGTEKRGVLSMERLDFFDEIRS